MKVCKKCNHFRSFRPVSQLLAHELTLNDIAVNSELLSIMKDEKHVRDLESEQKVELLDDREEAWDIKPKMSSFCGLLESKRKYLFHEIKNHDGGCTDHDDKIATQSCSTCAHMRKGNGAQKDEAKLKELASLSENAVALGQPDGMQHLTNYVQLVGTKKAFEAAQSYYAGKISIKQPEYLSICSKYSSDTDFIPCVIANPYDKCVDWSESASKSTPLNVVSKTLNLRKDH